MSIGLTLSSGECGRFLTRLQFDFCFVNVMKNFITMEIFMRGGKSVSEWVEFFRQLSKVSPLLSPITVGNTEPVDQPYSEKDLAEFWDWPFFWDGAKEIDGAIYLPRRDSELVMYSVRGEATQTNLSVFASLFDQFARIWDVQFGFVHTLREEELSFGREAGYVLGTKKPTLILPAHVLKKYIPTVFDKTIFGSRASSQLPLEHWEKEVEEIQLSKSYNNGILLDLGSYGNSDSGLVRARRDTLLRYCPVPEGWFFDEKKGASGHYHSPFRDV
ncbi:MAG: hypothetical protein RH862_14720 [Leptospiraceae bacterium]